MRQTKLGLDWNEEVGDADTFVNINYDPDYGVADALSSLDAAYMKMRAWLVKLGERNSSGAHNLDEA